MESKYNLFNTVYDNFVLEAKVEDILNTKLNTRSLVTVDNSLVDAAGTIKKINTYTYEGSVEAVEEGEGNTEKGKVTFTQTPYEVAVWQSTWNYSDESFLADPNVVEVGIRGGATIMVNDLNSKFFAEAAKATLVQDIAGDTLAYEDVVDAIAKMNLEDETGLFLVMGNDLKAQIRKDEDFKASQLGEILYTGQFGTISGVPVIFSKLCPAGIAYLMTKEAITLFTKKESQVEQDRDIETRINTVVMRKVNLIALTDNTKIVKINANGSASV